jgi:hypothetical protein
MVEVEGFVFIAENFDEEYLSRVRSEVAPEQIEATINTTYLSDLFGAVEGDRIVWQMLGERVRDSWKARAESLFPDREFSASFSWYSDDGDPGVTICQIGPIGEKRKE